MLPIWILERLIWIWVRAKGWSVPFILGFILGSVWGIRNASEFAKVIESTSPWTPLVEPALPYITGASTAFVLWVVSDYISDHIRRIRKAHRQEEQKWEEEKERQERRAKQAEREQYREKWKYLAKLTRETFDEFNSHGKHGKNMEWYRRNNTGTYERLVNQRGEKLKILQREEIVPPDFEPGSVEVVWKYLARVEPIIRLQSPEAAKKFACQYMAGEEIV